MGQRRDSSERPLGPRIPDDLDTSDDLDAATAGGPIRGCPQTCGFAMPWTGHGVLTRVDLDGTLEVARGGNVSPELLDERVDGLGKRRSLRIRAVRSTVSSWP